jgi:hypothetical protein
MSKDASRELVAEMAGVYREAEAARVANFHQRNGEAHLRHNPICAGQPVWTLHLEPVTTENAANHPGYVVLAGRVEDTREAAYEVLVNGKRQTLERDELFTQREDAEGEAGRCNAAIARRLAELHDGGLA